VDLSSHWMTWAEWPASPDVGITGHRSPLDIRIRNGDISNFKATNDN